MFLKNKQELSLFSSNTRMFINIFFVVLLSLAHGNPVPSDPVLISVNIERCREDPCIEGCEEEVFRQDALFDEPSQLIKVEGGDEYLIEMEDPHVSEINSHFVKG